MGNGPIGPREMGEPACSGSRSDAPTVVGPLPGPGGVRRPLDAAALQRALAGRYRLEGELGAGGMGRVFRATDLVLERPVALKTILPDVLAEAHWLERFRLEATVVAGLQHPGIAQLYEILDVEGSPVLVMEYVPGDDLRRAVSGGRLRAGGLAEIMARVCDAVAFAHSHGVIHRDVKPANVLLTADGAPKVVDFGLARHRGRVRSSALDAAEDGAVLGSPGYMAPEQARGDSRHVDSRTDIYGLGATLYFALTGRPPHAGGSFTEVLEDVVRGAVVPPSRVRTGVSRDLEAICLKAMARDPERRYASAVDMACDLRSAMAGGRVSARRYGFAETVVKAVAFRREPFLFAVAAVLVMLAGLYGAVLSLHGTARASMLEGLRRQVTDLAGTAALMIDPAWVRQQVEEAPATGKLSSLLGLIQAQNPDIRYVWVMRRTGRTPTEMAFIAVSASGAMPAASPRTEKPRANPEPARPGQLFEAAPFPALLEGFERPAADPTDEVADEWGVALSGYAPIKDEAGRSIAVLGVDISRDDLDDELADLDRALAFSLTLAATLAASALLLILATVVGRWGRKAQAPER